MVQEIKNLDDFTSSVGNENTGLIVIDFYADWCGPCKMIAPKYAKLAEKYQNVQFYKLNSDNGDTANVVTACEITSLPTFCFFKGGKYVTKLIGANDAKLEKILMDNLPKNNVETQAHENKN
jgi:thioredoxin 1